MLNILVTGAAGFIASHLIDKLITNKDYYIVGIDNINNFYDINIKHRNKLRNLSPNYNFITQGILNDDAISKLFQKYNFDIVFHFAALPGVSYSIENSPEVLNINVIGFDIICRNAAKYKTKHFIYASSSSIYGDNGIQKSPYAVSKKTNELQALMYSQLYPDTKFSGLRLFTVYGDNMRPDLAIYKFMDAMYKHNDIHIYGDGMQMRDFTYIDDVVDGIIHIMKSDKYWQCETFDIGRGEPVSINNLLLILKNKIDPNYNKIIYENKKDYDAINTCANPTKMLQWFQFKPKYSLYDGINKFIDSFGNGTCCIFIIIKNEHEYLDDFIKYHLNIGVNHIFIFEDYNSNTHKNIVEKYNNVTLFSVDIIKNSSTESNNYITNLMEKGIPLLQAFIKYGLSYIKSHYNYNWCIAIDIDEYITCDDNNIINTLHNYQMYDAIILLWKNFGATGHIYKPDYTNKCITDIYTTPIDFSNNDKLSETTKIIYNLTKYNHMYFISNHSINKQIYNYCYSDYSKNKAKNLIYTNIYIRHYITKSWEEYFWKIKIRGMFYKKHRELEEFFFMNKDLLDKQNELITSFLNKYNKITAE